MSRQFRYALIACMTMATLVNTGEAYACASCGCTLSSDWGSQGVSTKEGLSADLSETYINQNQLIYGNSKPSAAFIQSLYSKGQEIETATMTQTTIAALNYNDEMWGIGILVPYLHRTHGTNGIAGQPYDAAGNNLGANYSESSDSGVGDIRVVGHYNGFFDDNTSGLVAGVKFATGNTNANFTSGAIAGTPLDSGLQLGTGSTDIILGAYTSGTVRTYGWFVQGTVQHSISGLVNVAGQDYRPGDTYLINSGIRYAGFGTTFNPMLQLNLLHKEYDQGSSIAVPSDVFTGSPVSGGNLAYLSPGLSIRLGGGTSVYGFVQIPVYQNVGSLQLVPQYIASVGVHQNL